MDRARIIISLTTAGAKNSVTIFALEPNCSQTPPDVYSVEENYPAFWLRNGHRVRIPRQRIFLSFILYPLETCFMHVTGKPQSVWLRI